MDLSDVAGCNESSWNMKPVNNKVHIISEQTGYNQTIFKAAKSL